MIKKSSQNQLLCACLTVFFAILITACGKGELKDDTTMQVFHDLNEVRDAVNEDIEKADDVPVRIDEEIPNDMSVNESVDNMHIESEVDYEHTYDPKMYSWSKMNQGPYHDKVSFATSSNLLSWKDSRKILAEHASVPDVVYKNGVLFVYFVDVTTDGYPEKLGVIISKNNGQTWSERTFINIKGLGEKVAVDPAPLLLDNGLIRLFYYDIAENRKPEGRMRTNKIYSAISEDGINFREEEGVRFEHEGIFDPCVIKASDNLWRMYVGNQDGQKVFSATSEDGLTFSYEGVAYIGGAIPNVIAEDGKYYLFTGGIDISTSEDGISFKKTGKRFDSGKLTADPGVVNIGPSKYLMVYKTKDII